MSNLKTEVNVMCMGGVGDNVTGSSEILNCRVHGKIYNIAVDSGISQGKFESRNEQYPLNGENLSAIIITHAHMDHMGGIAMLKHFKGKIYGTKEALLLGYEIIYDSVYQHIKKAAESRGMSIENYFNTIKELEDMKRRNSNPEEQKDLEDVILDIEQSALYNYDDVERIRKCFCFVEPLQRFVIAKGIYGRLVPNSHQLGAVAVEIYVGELYEEDAVNISFSGDIGPKDSLLYHNLIYDPNVFINYAWMESTHGIETRQQSTSDAYKELKERVFEAYKRNGTLIIGTFALDRSAKILYLLNKMIDETDISIPIYWDTPLGYTELRYYQEFYQENKGFWFKNLGRNPFDDNELILCKNKAEHENALNAVGPKIIITASAFGEGGRINDYFSKYIEDENADFIFASWLSPECTSSVLFQAERFSENLILIHGEQYHKKCQTHQITGLTSHGYYPEFVDYIERFPNLNGIVLNHGERSVKNALAEKIQKDYHVHIVIPELYDEEHAQNSFFKLTAEGISAIPSIEGYKIFESVMTNI